MSVPFVPGTKLSADLEEKNNFGGYIGTSLTIPIEILNVSAEKVADSFQIQAELQFINGLTAGGVSFVIPFM